MSQQGLVTPVRERWTCCEQEEQELVAQNNTAKVAVAPGKVLGDIVSPQLDKADGLGLCSQEGSAGPGEAKGKAPGTSEQRALTREQPAGAQLVYPG